MIAGRSTRRELVSAGFGAAMGGTFAGAGVVSGLVSPGVARAASAPAGGDAGVLSRTLSVEQLVVFSYQRVLASGPLKSTVAAALGGLLTQELRHVSELERDLRTIHGSIPSPPRDVATAQRALATHHVTRSLTRLRTQHDCLKLLIDVESVAEGAYFAAIGTLGDAGRVRTALGIMGCEAQHWTILSGLLNRYNVVRSVPYPFVAGAG